MPSSLTSLNAAIANFTKVDTSNTQYSTLITNAVARAYYDVTRDKGRIYPEIIKHRTDIATAAMINGTTVALPADFVQLIEVRYIDGPTLREWVLSEYATRVPPSVVYRKPNSYKIVSGLTLDATGNLPAAIIGDPFAGIADVTGEKMVIDYICFPPVNSLILGNIMAQEIQDRATAYVLLYQGKLNKSQELLNLIRTPMVNPPQNSSS